jgi:aspartate aminotransferase
VISSIKLAPSLAKVTPSQIRQLADVAFGMQGVLKLQFGESTLATPAYIKDALQEAVAEGYTFYSENRGLPSLRATLAAQIALLHNVAIDPADEILVTASGTQALNVSIRCTVDPGDEAIVLTPNWPNGAEIVRMFGATPVEAPYCSVNGRWALDREAITQALTPRTRLLIYTSPSNPLGWVASVEEQQWLLDFCREHGLWLLADEVYERLYFGGPVAPSILRLCRRDDAVIVVQSFSKTYCMTGWRLGWVVSRRDLVQKGTSLNEFIVSHAATMTQRAGEAALRLGEDDVASMVETLQERLEFCYQALQSVDGVNLAKPQGAFYLFPRLEGLQDSYAFALRLLQEEKVAVAPGVAFGAGGTDAVRICFAPDMNVLEPAMERICRFIARHEWEG